MATCSRTSECDGAASRNEGDIDDDPGASSASQCIRLRHMGHEFGPVYTHQCFPGEWIPGYMPTRAGTCGNLRPPHRSYENHALATHRLFIGIDLAPDCSACQISIETVPLDEQGHKSIADNPLPDRSDDPSASAGPRNKRPLRRSSLEAAKRVKLLSQSPHKDGKGDDEEDNQVSGNTEGALPPTSTSPTPSSASTPASKPSSSEEDEEYRDTDEKDCSPSAAAASDDDDNDIDHDLSGDGRGTTRDDLLVGRMSPSDIRLRLAKALPPVVATVADPVGCGAYESPRRTSRHLGRLVSHLPKPLGTVLVEESGDGGAGEDGLFCLALATGTESGVASYHSRVQRLAVWYIETADDVDVGSVDQGGYWKVLYAFRKGQQCETGYSLAGYMTLFHFRAPFRKPRAGTVLRVCQALVLPPYQGLGLGRRMLHAVYDVARRSQRGGKDPVVEVNVEDPAPAFAALRTRVDWERYSSYPGLGCADDNVLDEAFFNALSDAAASDLASQLLITVAQVHAVRELVKLRALLDFRSAGGGGGDDAAATRELLEKRYRLMVKKRLQKIHRGEMGGMSKAEAQLHLAELFDRCHSDYLRILRRKNSKSPEAS